jgi:uncharacterized membrane protein
MKEETEQKMVNYLAELRASLGQMPIAERDEILREIGAHIGECAEESDGAIADVLARLGAPQQLAAEYRNGILVRKAAQSFSPWLLLRATGRLATKSFTGVAIFLCAVAGYGMGAGFVLTALLKPFMPHLIGLWVGTHFTFGFWGSPIDGFGLGAFIADRSGVHEVLGVWYIPVALAAGGILLQVTTLIIRKLLRIFAGTGSRASATWNASSTMAP